jgi:hypothetical protein
MIRHITRFASVAVLSVFLIACGSKLTQANFDKVNDGMTYDEVVDILGEPESSNGGKLMRECIWKDDKYTVKILFRNEKMEDKTMSDISAEAVKTE